MPSTTFGRVRPKTPRNGGTLLAPRVPPADEKEGEGALYYTSAAGEAVAGALAAINIDADGHASMHD
jgi:hypothetical protein